MARAAIYSRISSDPEGTAAGVERQEEDSRKLAKRHRWEVADTYRDNDVSATSGRKRPAWDRLLKDLEAGTIDAVVAYSSSRMYRRPKDLQRLIEILNERPGVEVDTVTSGKLNLSTADGRMIAGLLATIDQGEAERAGERMARARRKRLEKGLRWGGSRRAFGYNKDWTINPEEASRVKEAAERIIGGESVYRICTDWKHAGVMSPYGRYWNPSHLKRTLSGRHLLGGETWPALISEDQHRLLLSAFKRNGKPTPQDQGRVGRPRGTRYVLTGILRCAICNEPVEGKSGRYSCGTIGCAATSIKATPVERWLVTQAFVRSLDQPKKRKPSRRRDGDLDALLSQMRKVDEELEQLGEQDLPISFAMAAAKRLEAKRDALQKQIASQVHAAEPESVDMLAEIIDMLGSKFAEPYMKRLPPKEREAALKAELAGWQGDFGERWEGRRLNESEVARLKDFVRGVIPEATLKRATRDGRLGFDPDRIEIGEAR